MASTRRVAVVTGANKGIGYAVVRALCKQFEGDVFLTARNEGFGMEAVKQLNGVGLFPKFHQLDITDRASIERIKSFLKINYGGLDVLVNNAGIAFFNDSSMAFSEEAELTMRCNFWGTLSVCNMLFPILRPHARVVNVSSRSSNFAYEKCSEALRAKFLSPSITIKEVELLMEEFVSSAKDGSCDEKGWDKAPYGVSKIGVTLMSFIQQRLLLTDPRVDIIVNACTPGYVDTDMSQHKGVKTIDEGADTPVYLSLLPPGATSPRGEFVGEREIRHWPQYDIQELPDVLQKQIQK